VIESEKAKPLEPHPRSASSPPKAP